MTRRMRDEEILSSLADALDRLGRGLMPRTLRRTLSAPGDPTPLYDDLCAEFGHHHLFGDDTRAAS